MQSVKNSNKDTERPRKKLNALSLAGLGIGGIVGSGFFLGSAISIKQAGPSVILAFLLSGFIISQVLGAMTSISINRPVTGSFKVYAEQFLGKYTGFMLGWTIFIANILGIGSEAIAAGIFLKYWLPHISAPVLAVAVLLCIIAVNRLNTEKFSIVESGMAALKILALLFFISVGVQFVALRGAASRQPIFDGVSGFFPMGVIGFIQSMLIAVFTFSGISTVAMATSKVKNPEKDIPKATVILIAGITFLYVAVVLLVVYTVNWSAVNTDASPLVQSLTAMGYAWASAIINAAVFIAAFSVMLGTYFGSIQVLLSLSNAAEAPRVFGQKSKQNFYRNAWLLTGLLALLVVVISFFLSTKLFNYLISACTYFSFYNWSVNIIVYLLWLKRRKQDERFSSPLILGRFGGYLTLFLIAVLAAVSLSVKDFRVGFYSAAGISVFVSIAFLVMRRRRKISGQTEAPH